MKRFWLKLLSALASHQGPGDETDLVAKGAGGRLVLSGNRLTLSRGGLFGLLLTLLGFEGGYVDRVVRIDQIAAIEIDKPALFFRYLRVSYPGAPQLTGNNLRDMMAENAILMSLVDNRPFYRLMARIEEMMDAKLISPHSLPSEDAVELP